MEQKKVISESAIINMITEVVMGAEFIKYIENITKHVLSRYRIDSLTDLYKNVIEITCINKDEECLNMLCSYADCNEDEIYDKIYDIVSSYYDEHGNKSDFKMVMEDLTRSNVRDEIEDYIKNKDFEKRVHNIVVDVFRTVIDNMWTKKSFWSTMLTKK